MTPYEIEVLIFYYARAEDHPDLARNPPIWRPTIAAFLREGVLAPAGISEPAMCYELTDRGRAYVESLLRVPLPEACWKTHFPAS